MWHINHGQIKRRANLIENSNFQGVDAERGRSKKVSRKPQEVPRFD